jgi:ABC-2 type transport system ATP-binding protein
VIEVHGLSRRFGKFLAVDDVHFHVERGEIFGYLGANGAGKSTTIRMLTGLLAPSSGKATVAGYDIATDPEGLKGAIGYMSQKFSLYLDLPVLENLLFFGGAYGLSGRDLRRRAAEALELTGLATSGTAVTGALPGGLRQRLALSCALLHRPEIVFLDEPTAGVDPEARRAFWAVIRDLARAGTTVFVTTHYLDEAEYCARIGLMVDGRLVALDTPAGLKRTYVPESVFVAHGQGLSKAAAALQSEAGVVGVAPFGAGLHLRVSGEHWDTARLLRVFAEHGASNVTVEASEPTLEDVFLEVVGRGAARTEQASS